MLVLDSLGSSVADMVDEHVSLIDAVLEGDAEKASALARQLPAARRTIIDPRAAAWVLPWLAGLLLLSWLGRYNGSPPTVFGVTLMATNHLPNWWDLAAIAAFSLVIYYWAVHSTLPHQRVSAAVEQVETEASVELDTSLV